MTTSFYNQIKFLGVRDLSSLLRILSAQNRKQKKYLIQNKHSNLTCNEEYMIEEEIYDVTDEKIEKIKFRMRNIIRKANKFTEEF